MFRKITVLMGTLAVALATVAVAAGQEPGQTSTGSPNIEQKQQRRGVRRHARRGARLGRMRGLRELNLTEAQKQQAQSLIRSNFESNKAVREELMQLMQKRRQGALSETDQARARQLRQQLHESRKNARTQLATLLTEEQKLKLEERRKNRRERRERSGRRGPARPI